MEVAIKFLIGMSVIIVFCSLANYYLRISIFWCTIVSFVLIITWINMTMNKVESCNWDCQQAIIKANQPEFKGKDYNEIIPKELKDLTN